MFDGRALETADGARKDVPSYLQYGETPLHMAAKNGCNEAIGLLLSHGASTVAKANEGMTPLNHLSQGQRNEKLQSLLKSYLEEQRKRRAIEACSQTKAKMDKLENELSNLVGLHELKLQLRKWAKGMLLDERRRAIGLKVGSCRPPYMPCLGNPGTGKTLVARILGKLLFMVRILPTHKLTEVQRTDLVGEFVGHTGPKTRRLLLSAISSIFDRYTVNPNPNIISSSLSSLHHNRIFPSPLQLSRLAPPCSP
ncbi:hypothetical protein L2E82_35579 [Cichorium intybus]|uniref:Uncharacterized protein n=1 Tax=Cichorium intybus TaxID=13427 RepID=A0ACB9BPB2_CICIN|nr:hypothetical protein L2E82_35579 [Cichorium intybus]